MESVKKNLVWYISFGSYESKEMTKNSILSLLKWGNYKGDIIVLSDDTVLNDNLESRYPNIRVINVKENLSKIGFPPELGKFEIFCVKPIIYQYVDVKEYNYLLYLDSDTLITNKKINYLFDYWADIGKIQIQHNAHWNTSQSQPSTGSEVLTEEMKLNNKTLSLCAGVFGCPGNKFGEQFLKDWDAKNKEGNFRKDDQGNLFYIIIEKYLRDFQYCDDVKRADYDLDKTICHYGGSRAKHMVWIHSINLFPTVTTDFSSKILGKWKHTKPHEGIDNIWEFTDDHLIKVDSPFIVGYWRELEDYVLVTWLSGGFEKIYRNFSGASYRGGVNSFKLDSF